MAIGENLLERVKESLLEHAGADRLITEQALCKPLKLGRSTIREALGCFQEQGLIHADKKGTTLCRPGLKEMSICGTRACAGRNGHSTGLS